MNIKKVNRLCTVKGCKNTASYAISRSSEYGGIIICKSCLEEALKAVDIAEEKGLNKVNTNATKEKSAAALFYHPEEVRSEDDEKTKPTFICSECGKVCGSAAGLKSHMKTHKDGDEE